MVLSSPSLAAPWRQHATYPTVLSSVVNARRRRAREMFCLLVGCLTSQQHASVSQGRICTDNFTCCHTETEVADPTFYLTQSQYTDTGQTSPSADPITRGAWQGSHWSANFLSRWYDSTPEKSWRKRDSNPGPSALEADALTTRPTRGSEGEGREGRCVCVWGRGCGGTANCPCKTKAERLIRMICSSDKTCF